MTPHFFYISDISNSSTLRGKSLRKNSKLENFRANVLNWWQISALGNSNIDFILTGMVRAIGKVHKKAIKCLRSSMVFLCWHTVYILFILDFRRSGLWWIICMLKQQWWLSLDLKGLLSSWFDKCWHLSWWKRDYNGNPGRAIIAVLTYRLFITNHSAETPPSLDTEKSAVNFFEFSRYVMYGDTNCTA